MKRTLLKTLALVACLIMSFATFAVPADPKPVTVKQPNGKTLTFYLKGDERMSWAVTLDGYSLLNNKDGNFVYAIKNSDGNMVASSVLACNAEQRNSQENTFLASVPKYITYSTTQKQMYNKLWESKVPTKAYKQNHFPAKGGKKNLLVVLVSFADLEFSTDKSVFEDMCMQENYKGSGSISQYYYTTSGGELDLQIDVVGPVTLPNSMEYYGGHETRNYGGTSYEIKDKNTKDFVRHAIAAVNDLVDFSKYDNDGDGIVDDIAFIYAGTPESTTGHPNEIWPHSSETQFTELYDGVRINRYTCSAEKPDQVIGTFCHEFGHALGLPDEYDTDYAQSGGESVTVGSWSLMCQGSYNNNQNTPPLWSAGQKIRTGWIDTVIVLDVMQDSLRLPVITGSHDTAYRINISGTQEFFLIESRKKHGFDSFLPGEGLLIYHGQMDKIDSWNKYGNNSINVTPADRGWFIEPADGLLNSTTGAAASFPGAKNIRNFVKGAANYPKLVKGTPLDTISVTNVQYLNDTVMLFNYNSTTPVVKTNNPSAKTVNSMNVSGTVIYKGGHTEFASKGIIYSLEEECEATTDNVIADDNLSDTDSIKATISGLQNNTKYYYRAFVVTNDGRTALGDIVSATTQSGLGYVITQNPTNIDSTSAILKANLSSIGQGDFVEGGFVYIADNNLVDPTIEDTENCTKIVVEGLGLGTYEYKVEDLQQGSNYYYRAYITNTYGTYYGTTKQFQTLYPEIKNNTISASQQICLGSTPNELKGNEATGGFGDFTYLWQQQSGYSSWGPAEGVNNEKNYQPSDLTATTNYRRIATSKGRFTSTSNTITVEVLHSVAGTINTSKDIYTTGEEITLTLRNYSGSIVEWLHGTDSSALISIGNSAKSTLTQTIDQEGTYFYQVKVQSGQCEAAMTNIKTITVGPSSINDAENSVAFDIMPNPSANGTFSIISDINNAQSLVITNAIGQVVYSDRNVDLTNKTITLNNAENGSYFISIISNDNLTTKKLIINK